MNLRPMTDVEKRAAAKSFVETWTGRGDEKQDAQNFWRMLLSTVYGMVSPESEVDFEYCVKNDQTGSTIFIDAYPDSSLADLYNEAVMPQELRKAHQQNDIAVLAAYGIGKGDPAYGSESACVAFLMKRYQELTDK